LNLDDNIVVQNVAMVLILVAMVSWFSIFLILGLDPSRVPSIRPEAGLSAFHGMGGTILFNFMFISTLPSWVCEKHPSVTAMRVIPLTLACASVIFVVVGLVGGLAFPEFYLGDNTLLSELHHIRMHTVQVFADISVDVYAIASNLSSIPIFCIMMRYNLIEQDIMGPRAAGFVSIILPWLFSVVLYCGSGFQNVVQFAGSFTSSIVNLIIPSLLFIASQRVTDLASPSSQMGLAAQPSLQRDRSGVISNNRSKRIWLKIAWVNVFLMSMLTAFVIGEQILTGDSS